jgi:MoaA/NifB/PqqE/SkfB family radical SAM enzyme
MRVLKAAEIKALRGRATTYCYNYPSTIQLETTTRCNLKCSMCPRVEELADKGLTARDMSFEEFKDIIDQTKGLFAINLFGRGEPLMCKEIFRMIDYCADRPIPYVGITTNGLLLKGRVARELSDTKLTELRVSVDGSDAETYRKVRNADLSQVVDNLREFRRISDIPMSINYVLGSENFESVKRMPAWTAGVGAQCLRIRHLLFPYPPPGGKPYNRREHKGKYATLIKNLADECRSRRIALQMEDLDFQACLLPFIMAFIDIDGYLTPCCKLEKIRLANVHQNSLFSAWNSKPMREWRRRLLVGSVPKICADIDCLPAAT